MQCVRRSHEVMLPLLGNHAKDVGATMRIFGIATIQDLRYFPSVRERHVDESIEGIELSLFKQLLINKTFIILHEISSPMIISFLKTTIMFFNN